MAYPGNALTILKMTTVNSSVAVNPTMQQMHSATGVYIDVSNVDASKMILVMMKEASAANTASGERIYVMNGDTADARLGYSGYKLGNLAIDMSSVPHSTKPTGLELNCCFAGPFETARFKDTDGYISIRCSNSTNTGAIGVIFID